MENYANDAGREFGWDDEIQNDSPDRVVLPEGEYPFEVTKFERQRHPGSAKLPPCAMALLTIQIDGGEKGPSVVTHRLYLHTRTEGLLCAFFESIGQRKHGEALRPRWNEVNGSRGRCRVGIHEYINLELDRASCFHRFRDVYTAMGLNPENLRNIDVWNLRGASVPMDKLAPKLIRRAAKSGYIAVVLDPIYKVITGDENSADQMAKFCNQFDLVCRELGCAVIYCHHHSKGAQGGKRSMDRASGSGVFARDPDAMLDMTELEPTEAIRTQMKNRAACAACCELLDKRGHGDAYGPDDALSKTQMLAICKDRLGQADLRMLDAEIERAAAHAMEKTAWRIEGTLREFARFAPVNLWFDYPVHQLDSGLLEDLQPETDFRTAGRAGAAKRWAATDKEDTAKKNRKELATAFEACTMDGEVTVYAMAEYMDLKPRTIKQRLKADGGYWIDGEKVGRKEPGYKG